MCDREEEGCAKERVKATVKKARVTAITELGVRDEQCNGKCDVEGKCDSDEADRRSRVTVREAGVVVVVLELEEVVEEEMGV